MTDEQAQMVEEIAERVVTKVLSSHDHCLLSRQFESFEDISILVRLVKFFKMAETTAGKWLVRALLIAVGLIFAVAYSQKIGG